MNIPFEKIFPRSKHEYINAKAADQRLKAFEYLGGSCVFPSCGITDKDMLQFHHVRPEDKTMNISNMLQKSWEVLRAELDKCVILCCNHHSKIHADRKKGRTDGYSCSLGRFN